MQGIFILLIIIATTVHLLAIGSGLMVVKKYESCLQKLTYFCIFDVNNFYSHRLWFVLLSLIVSFGYLIFSAELFIQLTGAFKPLFILKYILMNLAVGALILQYNYFILKDRRR